MKSLIGFLAAIAMVPGLTRAEALVLSSDDSGLSWNREYTGCMSSLNSVCFDPSTGRAVAVGDRGAVLLRSPSGEWSDVSPKGLNADLHSVAMGTNGVCMACGDQGSLLGSFDGGESWSLLSDFQAGSTGLRSVCFDPVRPSSFVIAGEGGFIYLPGDGERMEGPPGDDFVASGTRLCSGGPTFTVSEQGFVAALSQVEIPSLNVPVSVTGASVLVSGGSPFILVGRDGAILRLQDEWVRVESPVSADLNAVANILFGSAFCAVGAEGVILISSNNGSTWSEAESGTGRTLNGVAGNGTGTAVIVGETLLPRVFRPWR